MLPDRVTRIQSVVLRRIGGRGHFRSRDKDGSHTIRSTIAENPLLYANFTMLSFMESELLQIKVFHCVYSEFRQFIVKMVENIKYFICTAKLIKMIYRNTFSGPLSTVLACNLCNGSYTHSRCCFTPIVAESVGVVSSGHVTKMAVTPFDPQWPKTPCYTQTSRLLSFINFKN